MSTIRILVLGSLLSCYALQATANNPDASRHNDEPRQTLEQLLLLEPSESRGDIDLVARVRRALLAQDGLSAAGQNIRIITGDGRVTLRGSVRDSAERASIDQTVRRAAGRAPVDNQLAVPPELQQLPQQTPQQATRKSSGQAPLRVLRKASRRDTWQDPI